jgi:HD-GYP domain-containing protein (c-di-GMP phosphodiesterase class II)
MVIKSKIIAIISLAIIFSVTLITAILLKVQGDELLRHSINETAFVGDVIEKSLSAAMLSGDTDGVQVILENIGGKKELLSLRILSIDGTILKSADKSEIGSKAKDYVVDLPLKTASKSDILSEEAINHFRNIKNKKECTACHDSRDDVIAVVQVKQDVSRNVATMVTLKRLLLFSNFILIVIVSITFSTLFNKMVAKPLKNLLSTIRDVESGNWNATAKNTGKDELGVLSSSFNKMIDEMNKLYKKNLNKERELSNIKVKLEHKTKLEELNTQLELKIKEVESANKAISSLSKEVRGKNIELEKAVEKLKKINEIGRVLTSIIETEELMKIIIRSAAELVQAEKVTLHLSSIQKSALTIQYRRGLGIDTVSDFYPESDPSYSDLMSYGKPVMIPGFTVGPDSGGTDNISKIGVPMKMKGKIIGAVMIENKTGGNSFTDDEFDLLSTLSNQAMVAIENASLYDNVKSNYFAAIQSLVNALEANDRFTRGHSERVKRLAIELGRYIGLDYREIEVLEHASILHDIGKIGIDSIVLQKQGKLTPGEYSLIKDHPMIGNQILEPIDSLADVRSTIIQHHERFDGKGYPNRLKGEEISLKSRILSVVDTFDAMMTERPYRNALSMSDILEELVTNAGSQFDPFVVDSFIEILKDRGDGFLASLGYDVLQRSL